MKADVARLLPASAQPSEGQWKMILSSAISTCVVAGAGSGKSSSLALRIVFLTQYLGIGLEDISVVTFTRASREDFAERLVRLFGAWHMTLALKDARARVTTFHATVLAWARTMPGFDQLRAFETLGGGQADASPLQLRINAAQRDVLNHCFQALMKADPTFAQWVQALRIRAGQLPRLPESHPEVQRRMAALRPAAQRDEALCRMIEDHWRAAGHWPLPGVTPGHTAHQLQGQVFYCHGYMPAHGAWVMLGTPDDLAERSRPGATMTVRAEWAVKRTLFQALFDKPLIWLDSYQALEAFSAGNQCQGAGIDYALAGEGGPQPLLDAFVSMASFIENLGLEVPSVVPALEHGPDGVFFQALGRYWPALERHLLAQSPPVLTYNRMFAIFTDPAGTALRRLPLAKLTAIRHLLVDEFQDVSPQIARWLRSGLAERLRRDASSPASLMCVGDDWQSIYGWRGSSPSFFLRFTDTFPAPTQRRLVLRENYRSHQQIIDAAEYIVKPVKSLPGKKAVAAGPALGSETAGRVRVYGYSADAIAHVAQVALDRDATVLLLYRQAKDDPRGAPPVAALFQAQAKVVQAGRLRCMTIHGAKGLEAEVVILVGDCAARPASAARNRLYALAELDGYGGVAPYDLAQTDEALRLAYVALTRAAREVHWFVDSTAAGSGQPGAAARVAGATQLFEDLRT